MQQRRVQKERKETITKKIKKKNLVKDQSNKVFNLLMKDNLST